MSAFVKTETQIKNINLLKEALESKGFRGDQIEIHETPQHLFGIGGKQRPEKAELIIRMKHVGVASNDIGFKKNESGSYDAIISSYDRGYKYNNKWLNGLKKTYTELQVKKTMKSLGATQLNQTESQKNGKSFTRLQFTVKG
jgi:Protein of unknown function (DUF1257)